MHRYYDPAGRRSFRRVVAVIAVIFVSAMAVQAWYVYDIRHSVTGDGENVASYGYDLSNLAVDPNLLVASGMPKDGQPAMTDPEVHPAAEVARLSDNEYQRVVVGRDMVVGVEINGEARAYPVRILNWHEIVNDTLGGVPIAVTFNPISRAAAVFDRRVGDRTLAFGYSGLLYNHNLVMYDHQADPNGQSLWSQLKFESIAGPRRGEQLKVLPMRLVRWEQWEALHPESSLLAGQRAYSKRYKRTPIEDAFRTGKPLYPAAPLPPQPEGDVTDRRQLHLASTIAAYESADGWVVVVEPFVQRQRIPDGVPVAYARWFAWYAMHGEPAEVKSFDLGAARHEVIEQDSK